MRRALAGMIATGLLLAPGPATALETVSADGHEWTIRRTNLNWRKDVAPPEVVTGPSVVVFVTDGRDIGGWPDGAIGATVTRTR